MSLVYSRSFGKAISSSIPTRCPSDLWRRLTDHGISRVKPTRSCLVPRRLSLDENWRSKEGRREGGLNLPSVPFPLSLAVHHRSLAFRARLYHAKTEAPEEEAERVEVAVEVNARELESITGLVKTCSLISPPCAVSIHPICWSLISTYLLGLLEISKAKLFCIILQGSH